MGHPSAEIVALAWVTCGALKREGHCKEQKLDAAQQQQACLAQAV